MTIPSPSAVLSARIALRHRIVTRLAVIIALPLLAVIAIQSVEGALRSAATQQDQQETQRGSERHTALVETMDQAQSALGRVQVAALRYLDRHAGNVAARNAAGLGDAAAASDAVTSNIASVTDACALLVTHLAAQGYSPRAFTQALDGLSSANLVAGHLARLDRSCRMLAPQWQYAQEANARTVALIRAQSAGIIAGHDQLSGAAANLVYEEQARLDVVLASLQQISDAMAAMATAVTAENRYLTDLRRVTTIEAEQRRQFWSQAMTVAVLAIALFGGIWAGARMITRPLDRAVAAMQALANDDLSHPVPAAGRDEIGQMLRALAVFRRHAQENHQMRDAQRQAEQQAEAVRRADLNHLAGAFETSVSGVAGDVNERALSMAAAARHVSDIARHATRLSADVAATSEQASTNVRTVAAAATELSASIAEIGRQVSESGRIANGAVAEAERTDHLVESLSGRAQAIGSVLDLISRIAHQTHMLALNATIEAARAGEAGRGFAVVAAEVKSLAAQTSSATDEIAAQINGMQGATEEAVAAIRSIAGTITRIDQIATLIAAAVEEQHAATAEIARNVQQAAEGTGSVSTIITDVSRGAQDTGLAADGLLASADTLASQSQRLQQEVNRFLAGIRAA